MGRYLHPRRCRRDDESDLVVRGEYSLLMLFLSGGLPEDLGPISSKISSEATRWYLLTLASKENPVSKDTLANNIIVLGLYKSGQRISDTRVTEVS
jgi:hypothetical protein